MNPVIEQFAIAAAVGGACGFLLLRPLLRRRSGKACGGDCCTPGKIKPKRAKKSKRR